MNTFISIVEKQFTQDDQGFKTETDVTVAEVRAYREGRHGSEKWANMASFSTATDLFQFRVIPGVTVTTDMRILRNALPYLEELNFPTLAVGSNTVSVTAANATFTGLEIQARSRWR